MDPNETLRNWKAASGEGAHEEAQDLAGYLEKWLADGGFAPDWVACGTTEDEFWDFVHCRY